MPSPTPWYLALFGGLRATRDQRTIINFRSQKFGALLAFLAIHPDRLYTREELLELLWPDAGMDSARTNLRAALSWLRRQFEEEGEDGHFLITQGNTHVRLNPQAFRTDVAVFEKHLRTVAQAGTDAKTKQSLLEQAIDLYSGPLLTGIYDNWALSERERLADRYQFAVTTLAEMLSAQGEQARALDYARRGVTADPLREETNLLVVRLLARSGETAAARRHYEEFARLLDDQMGIKPSTPVAPLLEARAVTTLPVGTSVNLPEKRTTPPSETRSPLKKVANGGTLPPSLPSEPQTEGPRPASLSIPAPRWMPSNRFVGREAETDTVLCVLRSPDIRLMTITGPGGSGKTRLAQEAARQLGETFSGGIWFVPLSDARSAPDLAAVATTLEIPPAPTLLPVQQISAALNVRTGRTLLILDNLEQIVDDAASFVETLLDAVPSLSILTTSRIRLGCTGEQELPLMPLPLPAENPVPGDLTSNPSAALFVDRMRAVRPDFAVTERNAAAISRICRRLDGIPLALELAAAWAQTLTPTQIAERLSSKFDLLVSRRRGVPERHATLRNAIDWSYRLLSAEQQTFFARLSIFRGGWTLEAAEEVCGEPDALEMLAELQERSLIIAVEAGDAMRYRMLETLREFAADQLSVTDADDLAHRHAAFFLRLVHMAFPKLWAEESVQWLDRLEADHDNFRAAIEGRLTAPDGAYTAVELCRRLYPFWDVRGYAFEGRRYLTAALNLPNDDIPCETRAGALYALASFALLQSDLAEAETLFQECFDLLRSQGNQTHIVDTLCRLGLVQYYRRNFSGAETMFREGLAMVRMQNNPGSEAHLLKCLGAVLREQGLWEEAGRCYDEAIHLYRRLKSEQGIAMMLGEMATLAQDRRDFARMESLLQEQWSLALQIGSITMQSYSLQLIGTAALAQEKWQAAMEAYQASLARREQVGERTGVAYLNFLLGYTALRQRDETSLQGYLSAALDVASSLPDNIIFGCVLGLAAAFAVLRRDFAAASRLFGAAEKSFPDIFVLTRVPTVTPLDTYRQAAEEAVGQEMFAHCHNIGMDLTRGEATTLARSIA